MSVLNENLKSLADDYLFREIEKEVGKIPKGEKVINLGIGDVSYPPPHASVKALAAASLAMKDKKTFRGYGPTEGYDFFREAVADYYLTENAVKISPDEVFACDGAKSDFGSIFDLFGNVKVVIPDPAYPAYVDSAIISGCRVTRLSTRAEEGFMATPNKLSAEPCVVILCSPDNPTGAVITKSVKREWVDFALRTGSVIISDAAYGAFARYSEDRTFYSCEGAFECVIEINSLSKSASFTGLRCGYTIIPKKLTVDKTSVNALWKRIRSAKYNGLSYPVQRAAEAVLRGEGVTEMKQNVLRVKEVAKVLSAAAGDACAEVYGGIDSPYLFLRCPKNMTSWDLFYVALRQERLVLTPGKGFGAQGEGFVRLSAFCPSSDEAEASKRIKRLLKSV